MLRHVASVLALVLVAATGTGCLDSTYRVPRRTLHELANTPPERRGDAVRVIQGIGGSDDAPVAPAVQGDASIVIVTGFPIGGPAPQRPVGPPSGGQRPSLAGSNAKHDAKAWFVVAAIAAVALASTEGIRYDGWVRVHPMHPLHLRMRDGGYTWVPLAHLTPDLAARAEKGVLRSSEGPWTRLERAPLDREGFTYGLYLGARGVPSWNGDDDLGTGGHIQFGVHPLHMLGVMLDIGMAWRQNELSQTAYFAHAGLELRVLPLELGPLSAGGFGQLGKAKRLEDGPNARDRADTHAALGGLMELELTTRLTLAARLGRTWWDDRAIDELVLGVAIY